MKNKWFRHLLFLPPVLIAIAILLVAPRLKTPPEKIDAAENAVRVRVVGVVRLPLVLRAVGYGSTRAARTWEAVAEVSGRVDWLSDQLKSGKLVKAGSELLRIEDASYRLALSEAETQLNMLEVKERTTRASLALEERSQALLRKDLDRMRKLARQGTLSESALEEAERTLLKGEVTIQNLKNTLALNAAEREVVRNQIKSAELDVQRTRFKAPFDVRITERKVNVAQYANKGQLLFSADGLEAVEIEARFPIGRLRPLISSSKSPESDGNGNTSALERKPGALRLDARVRLRTATHTIEWEARVDRVSGLVDPETQTIGVVVVVDDPYDRARPGQRPPLIRNTFLEVELSRRLKNRPLVIPATALHEGRVYVLDRDKRLEIRPVKTLLTQGGIAVISRGLEEGETLVVSDPAPVVPGMLLDPVMDEKVSQRLKKAVSGPKGHQP